MSQNNTPIRKERTGTVISNKAEKTVTITIERKIKVPLYGKYIRRTKKFTAHDENNQCQIGDTVKIVETRPISKTKNWCISQIIQKKTTPQHDTTRK